MQCPKCQFENREGAKYCNGCGHKFDVAGGILILLQDLQNEMNISYLFITHDLATVKAIIR
jgi:uncharacterized membrane protein YvbJ